MIMVKQLIDETVNALFPLVVTIFGLGVAWLGKTLNAWLVAKVKSERLQLVLRRLGEVISTVVLELQQTEVALLKTAVGESSPGGRKITSAEGAVLLKTALDKIRTYLGPEGLKLLKFVLGLANETTVNDFLVSRIEATIQTTKNQPMTVLGESVNLQPKE
jgi:hypothetical protein